MELYETVCFKISILPIQACIHFPSKGFGDGEGNQRGNKRKQDNLGKIKLLAVLNLKNLINETHYLHLNNTVLLLYGGESHRFCNATRGREENQRQGEGKLIKGHGIYTPEYTIYSLVMEFFFSKFS